MGVGEIIGAITMLGGLIAFAIRQEGRINTHDVQIKSLETSRVADKQEVLNVLNRLDAKVDRLIEARFDGPRQA